MDIDKNIEIAKTPPSSFYTSESIFEKSKSIFENSYQFICHQSELLKSKSVVFADNVGIFIEEMKEYLDHVRNSGLYSSENIASHLEYRNNIYDAVEISIMK